MPPIEQIFPIAFFVGFLFCIWWVSYAYRWHIKEYGKDKWGYSEWVNIRTLHKRMASIFKTYPLSRLAFALALLSVCLVFYFGRFLLSQHK